MADNIPKIWYDACFTEDDGLYSCEHRHPTVAETMSCLIPDGGFIRAFEAGLYRSLNEKEYIDFLEHMEKMPWSSQLRSSLLEIGSF
jgi:hypothetical protein